MPAGLDSEKVRALRVALGEGLNAKDACKRVGVSRSSLYRLRDADPEFAALMKRNAHRARAHAATSVTAKRAFRSPAEPVSVVAELVDDANTIGGPTLEQLLSAGWAVFQDGQADSSLRASVYREMMRVKTAPMIAELARQGNATPVDAGTPRARLVLPDKKPPPA